MSSAAAEAAAKAATMAGTSASATAPGTPASAGLAGANGVGTAAKTPSNGLPQADGSAADTPQASGSQMEASSSTEALTPSQTAAILSYFKKRGFRKGEDTLRAELEALAGGAPSSQALSNASSIDLFDLAIKNVPRESHATAVGSGEASRSGSVAPGLPNGTASAVTVNGITQSQQQQLSSMGPIEAAAVEALMLDPTDRASGFRKLRNWCEGSLDIYQPELKPLLLPIFVHAYLDLVEMGYGAAAAAFYTANSPTFFPLQSVLLSNIRSISLPSHVDNDPLAQRFRNERYVVKMSASVFSLLLGWLTDGSGPIGGGGAGEGVGDEGKTDQEKRAREAILRILNERCRVQVIDAKPQELTPQRLEEGSGLTGAGPSFSTSTARSRRYPALQAAVVSDRDVVHEYNLAASGSKLKLGSTIPLNEKLETEVEKEIKYLDKEDGDKADDDQSAAKREVETAVRGPELIQPSLSDMPPQAPIYRFVDIQREVAKLRDARKALRFDLSIRTATGEQVSKGGLLGPSFMSGVRDASFNALGEAGARAARVAALPSICAYTYHDASDGLTCSTFSEDLSMMAAGFEESYVQVWSLKGQPLRRLKSNFAAGEVRDKKGLDRQRDDSKLSTRKLIGHSGPVYDVAFDPIGGSAASPRHLLSASGDATVRLWSLDTFSALVSYRGHNQPVWSVEWSPLGIYFATASADRTARLWSTERINPLRMYAGHLSDVDCLNFHPNGLYLATGSSDKTCRLWDVQRGACVRLFVGHQSAVNCVKISPDGRYLASAGAGNAPSGPAAGEDCSISLWDLGSGRRVKKMWGHTSPVLAMDFSADGSILMTSAADCQVRCWDVKSAGGPRKSGSGLANGDVAGAASNGDAPHASSNGASGTGAAAHALQQHSSADCVTTFYTKRTPMLDVHFTRRNLCVVAGAFDASV